MNYELRIKGDANPYMLRTIIFVFPLPSLFLQRFINLNTYVKEKHTPFDADVVDDALHFLHSTATFYRQLPHFHGRGR